MTNPTLMQKFASFVRPRAPRRILVADDHEGVREVTAEILRSEGYEVETACDGERAMFKLSFESFDLLVTDWMMPHLDGITLVKWLRAISNPIPVVMLSGSDLGGAEIAMIRDELVAVIAKPALPGHLLATVRSVLATTPPPRTSAARAPALQPSRA